MYKSKQIYLQTAYTASASQRTSYLMTSALQRK